jgi:hypothetical protein
MVAHTWMDGSCSVVEGESIALIEPLKGMVHSGFSHVIFETKFQKRGGCNTCIILMVEALNLLFLFPILIIFCHVIQTS